MSMPMSNLNNSGYKPGFGAGYPPGDNTANIPQADGHQASAPGAYGFVPGQPQGVYMPVPQKPPYGEALPNYGGQQLLYGGQQPPYGGQQPPYGGQQPPYRGQQPPYGAMVQPQLQYNGGGGNQPGPGYGPQSPIVKQLGMPPPAQPMPETASKNVHTAGNSNSNGLVDVGANVLRIISHSLYEKYGYLRRRSDNFKVIVEREPNK